MFLPLRKAIYLQGNIRKASEAPEAPGALRPEQAAHEGDGYTDQQLRIDFADKAGIKGDDLATFQRLYDTKAYADFAKKSFETMSEAGISGTSAYVVNGKKIKLESLSSNEPDRRTDRTDLHWRHHPLER